MVRSGLGKTRITAYRQVLLAATSALFIAIILLVFIGFKAGISAFLGGMVWFLPNLYFAHKLFGQLGKIPPKHMVKVFYIAEVVKLALSVIFFVLIIKFLSVAIGPLFIGYLATQFVFWLIPLMTELK